MLTILIGFLAGVITSLSPCVLPMVPILLADPAVLEAGEPAAGRRRVSVRRPLGIVADLGEPVLGRPPAGVAEDQLVEDLLVNHLHVVGGLSRLA